MLLFNFALTFEGESNLGVLPKDFEDSNDEPILVEAVVDRVPF